MNKYKPHEKQIGKEMYAFIENLFPICRSITGEGTRETLRAIQSHIPELKIKSFASGEGVFDWVIPDEWNIKSAQLLGPDGETVVDFANNNLHVLGYSEPVDKVLNLEELQAHLHSLPELPEAIPYVTSYYERRWGFSLTHNQRKALKPGYYRAKIDSTLAPGVLNYGEVFIEGESSQEVFLSTYVCHPSMANNELSGPAVVTWLVKWLKKEPRKYSYRVVFIPETIGSIAYLSRHVDELKSNVFSGFNVSCVGDDRVYSFLPSRNGKSMSDRVAKHVLSHVVGDFIEYSFLDRGSDERQYCAPGVDLPIASVMRSKYGAYPEYHTSLDDLSLVSEEGLYGSYEVLMNCLELIELNGKWKNTVLCEPQLGKRGLYPTLSVARGAETVKDMMNILAYCDGQIDVLELADIIGVSAKECHRHILKLQSKNLLLRVEP